MKTINEAMKKLQESKIIKEDSERVEFILGKEKRYIDPEKDKDLLDQLKAIKRKISHLEKYVSILLKHIISKHLQKRPRNLHLN